MGAKSRGIVARQFALEAGKARPLEFARMARAAHRAFDCIHFHIESFTANDQPLVRSQLSGRRDRTANDRVLPRKRRDRFLHIENANFDDPASVLVSLLTYR